MDPISIKFIKSNATPIKENTPPKTRSRIQLLNINNSKLAHRCQLACDGIVHSPQEGLFGKLLRKLGLRRWVVLHVQEDGKNACYAKISGKSFRDRLEVSKKEFNQHLKEGIDFTAFAEQRIAHLIVTNEDPAETDRLAKNIATAGEQLKENKPNTAKTEPPIKNPVADKTQVTEGELSSKRGTSLVDQDPDVGTAVIIQRLIPKAIFNEGTFVSSRLLADGTKRIRVHLYGKNYLELDAKDVFLKT